MTRILFVFIGLASALAWARSGGISTSSCTSCHGQSNSQQTTISVVPAIFNPGDTVTVRVRIAGNNSNAGLSLSSDSVGTFKAPQGTKLDSQGNLVHSSPKSASGGAVVFDILWTAPATAGGVIFTAATLMGNGRDGAGGDYSGVASFTTAYGCSGVTYFRDYDGDGVGNVNSGTIKNCSVPMYYAAKDGDCDENDEKIFPGAPERCNKKDDNCNAQIDEGLSNETTWPDADKDGYGDKNGVSQTGCSDQPRAPNNTDCNDTNAAINPKAVEVCNRLDDNCDGRLDEGAQVRCGVGSCAQIGPTCAASDCRPGVPTKERCNGFDDDCDGVVDNAASCSSGLDCIAGQCLPPGTDAGLPVNPGTGEPMPSADAGEPGADGGVVRMRPADGTCAASGLSAPWLMLGLALLFRKRSLASRA